MTGDCAAPRRSSRTVVDAGMITKAAVIALGADDAEDAEKAATRATAAPRRRQQRRKRPTRAVDGDLDAEG